MTSLRATDVQWGAEDRAELLATADESLDRLARLVDNLLDMSRLQAGALSVFPRPAGLAEIAARALDDLGEPGRVIKVDIPDDLPEVLADPGLLERVIANLAGNALRYAPAGHAAPADRQRAGRPGRAERHRPGAGDPGPGPGRGLHRRSSGSATPTTPPGSASAWPCPAA